MKKINIRFERDRSLDRIDVLIRAPERDETVTELIGKLSAQPPETLTVTDVEGRQLSIVTDDIVSVSVRDKLTLLTTEDGTFIVRLPLQNLEEMLDEAQFLRISRHELVNADKIEKYEFISNGMLRLVLTGGVETWASRRCIPAVRARMNGKHT